MCGPKPLPAGKCATVVVPMVVVVLAVFVTGMVAIFIPWARVATQHDALITENNRYHRQVEAREAARAKRTVRMMEAVSQAQLAGENLDTCMVLLRLADEIQADDPSVAGIAERFAELMTLEIQRAKEQCDEHNR